MKTIFYINSNLEIYLCPICYTFTKNIIKDKPNCSIFCKNCKEIILCICFKQNKFDNCFKKINKNTVEIYFNNLIKVNKNGTLLNQLIKSKDYFLSSDLNIFYETSILNINKIIYFHHKKTLDSSCESLESCEFDDKIQEKTEYFSYCSDVIGTTTYTVPNLLSFNEVDKYYENLINLFDKNYIGYIGTCKDCKNIYKSIIYL